MGTRVAARQALRWTVGPVSSSVFSPLQFSRCQLKPLCNGCRLFCSSTSPSAVQSKQVNQELIPPGGKSVSELSLSSLIDMGFTDTQAEQICDTVSKLRGGGAAKQALSTLTGLFVLGLNPSSVLKLLEKCPEIYTVKEDHLQQRVTNLRKLGLGEGSLQRLVAYYPQILTVPAKTVKNVVVFLREKCLFTGQQVTDILRHSPSVVLEDKNELEYKFQYVYFRMGVKQAEMVKTRLFRFSLDEVRNRHSFLERRGLYETPDKKGQTTILNPKLESILNISQDNYVTRVAKASAEEYDVFKRLMAREKQQEEEGFQGRIEADSDAEDDGDDYDEDDDEEEEEEEAGGKSGYRKRRKK